ncbi:MAG: contractile injection system protein, VgrG/Pvc8 family [Methanothrix sp.]|nr:contractile injection system protein, VgrG/Pvc8 family [Methanothrix sp.]
MSDISYQLMINDLAAGSDLLAAVQQIEFEDHSEMASILRLRLAVAVSEDGSGWTVLDDDIFQRLDSIKVLVNVDNHSETLIVAHVIEVSADLSSDPGGSSMSIVALDPSVLMNLEEKVRAWANMSDSQIASEVFNEYGFAPNVEETSWTRQEPEQTVFQKGTDIAFLRQLAWRNGFQCYVEANALTGVLEGHFHPPRLEDSPQNPLFVNMAGATNVRAFRLRHEMLRPTAAQITGLDTETLSDQPASATSISLPALGSQPTLGSERQRLVLLSRTGLALTCELQTYAQAEVDRASWAIKAEGEVGTVDYGSILRAKRTVDVHGAGQLFSGTYFVESVLHSIDGSGYTQRFVLRRNALGL